MRAGLSQRLSELAHILFSTLQLNEPWNKLELGPFPVGIATNHVYAVRDSVEHQNLQQRELRLLQAQCARKIRRIQPLPP